MNTGDYYNALYSRRHLEGALGAAFAVGTIIADRPPHRSVQAEFPHTALTSGV